MALHMSALHCDEAHRYHMLQEIREMAAMDSEPHPGPWCEGCWERRACKAGGGR